MAQTIDMTAGSIPGHCRRIAIPVAVGISFITLYNVVDNFFAGLLSTEGLAVLSLSATVLIFLTTVGLSMNAAMVVLVGNAIGAQKFEDAKRLAHQGLSYMAFLSFALLLVFLVLGPLLIGAISAPGGLRDLAIEFLNIAILSAPAFIMSLGANGILVAQGDSMPMLRAQTASFFANIGLNPLFMFGIPGVIPGLGIVGVAVSTLVCQAGVMAFILSRVLRSELMRRGGSAVWRPIRADYGAITAMMLPVQVGYVLMLSGIFIVQVYLKNFGPETIAAFGVGLRIEQALLLPALALSLALRAVASQNFGAGEYGRVREAFGFCARAGAGFMLLAALLLWVAGRPLMTLFTSDPEVVRVGADFLKMYGVMLPARALLFSMYTLLQALRRPAGTLLISVYQEILAIALFVGVFVLVLGMDVRGVWIGVTASVYTALFLAFFVTTRVARGEIGGLFRAGSS